MCQKDDLVLDMTGYSNFFRSLLRLGQHQPKWRLAALVSTVGLGTAGLLWQRQHPHHASSYSLHLKRYTASAEYPQLSKHSNLMARQLTPQVSHFQFCLSEQN